MYELWEHNFKVGTFFTLRENNKHYESDEREVSINYNKEQDDQNAKTLFWLSFLILMEVGTVGHICPAITGQLCDTSKSWRHVLIWIQWNGKKVGCPILFMWIPPKTTELYYCLIFHFKGILREWPFFFWFVSKSSNHFGTWLGYILRLIVNVNSGIEIVIWKKAFSVEFSVEVVNFWQHLRDKCSHINNEQEQSLPLC